MIDARVLELFLRLVDVSEDERARWLEAGDDDPEVRAEVAALLEYDARASTAPERPAVRLAGRSVLEPGTAIGAYRIVEALGEGAFSEVYAADQLEPVRRRVALKILKLGVDSESVLRRFHAEQQALALLDHPHVARVFDAGVTPAGRSFFVMELAKGQDVVAYCAAHELALEARLRLFAAICLAVHHAHQKGIIHRDLKPSNVLVTERDGVASPKVIDFGIARSTGAAAPPSTRETQAGQLLGTPLYMAPEQAEGRRADVRSDVFALGAILYELLTGAPWIERAPGENDLHAVLQRVREAAPVRPSARAPSRRARRLRGDLDWITLKALAREPDARYVSCAALAADIERHLRARPVEAARPSRLYAFRRFVRRNRAPVFATGALGMLLVGATCTSARLAFDASRARAEAEAEVTNANDVLAFLTQDVFGSVDPTRGGVHDLSMRAMLDLACDTTVGRFPRRPRVQARILGGLAHGYQGLALHERAIELSRSARDLLLQARGARDGETLAAQVALVNALVQGSRLDEASRLAGDVARDCARSLEESDPIALRARRALGVMHNARRELGQAADVLEPLLADARRLLGPRHLETARIASTLGSVYTRDGRPGEAEVHLRVALDVCRAELGAGHHLTLGVQSNLAGLLWKTGMFEESELLLREGIELRSARFGADHPEVLKQEMSLGTVLSQSGRHDAAEALMERAHAALVEQLGAAHKDALVSLNQLFAMHQWRGELELATPLVERYFDLHVECFGHDHESTQRAYELLEKQYLLTLRFEDARRLAERQAGS